MIEVGAAIIEIVLLFSMKADIKLVLNTDTLHAFGGSDK